MFRIKLFFFGLLFLAFSALAVFGQTPNAKPVESEAQLAARLQAEQAKLSELNDSLDKLERELENAAADEKGKRP